MLANQLRTRVALLSLAATIAAVLACGGAGPDSDDLLATRTAAVTGGPDLVIQSVLGPASSVSGAPFTVTVTMCNNGDQPANAPAGVYLTSEAGDGGSDGGAGAVQIGQTPYASVMPGTCVILTANAGAYVPNGIYVLSAIADPTNAVLEVIETNNSKNGNRIGVGNAPDFTTSQVSGPPSALGGASIPVSALLCNQGTQPGSVPVDIYFSLDSNITTADTLVGTLPAGPTLQPGTCNTLSGTVWANAPNGAYYLGAYADRPNFTVELIENNNTSAGNRIGVGNAPDLVVQSVSAPAGAYSGSAMAVTAVLCNQGTAGGGGPVDVYFSTDANITTADTWLGTLPPAPPLNPGTCAAVTGTINANAPNGAYYVGAIADRSNGLVELIENNNATAGNKVAVGSGPDFVISSVTSAASVTPGGPLLVSAQLCNQGTQPGSVPVDVFLSQDATITAADFFVGTLYPPPGPVLDAGACTTLTGTVYASVPTGRLYLGAIADRNNSVPELIENNNTTLGNRVAVGNGPDFTVTSVVASPSAPSGGLVSMAVTVCNQGTQPGSATVEAFFSLDGTVTTADVDKGPLPPMPWLEPGTCATLTGNVYAPSPDGLYYAGAIADPFNSTVELAEDNNAAAGNKVGVGNKPDLLVTQVSGPASATGGGSMTVTAMVCNQGTQFASAPVDFFLSSDATITGNDWWIGSLPGPSLQPGTCAPVSGMVNASAPIGAYFLGAIVDKANGVQEFQEDNNAAAGNRIGVGNGPDLVVTSVTAPPSATAFSSVTVSARVCNQGTQGGSAPVDVYFSSDATITIQDPWSNTLPPTPWLNPGACATVSGNVPVVVGDGVYVVGAIVDRNGSVFELIEDNNATAGPQIGVGNKPDFAITQVSAPASATAGSQVQMSVTYCNQGTQSGSATVDLFFSSDSTITTMDPYAGSLPPGPMLQPGQCTTVTGPAYVPGPDGVYYVGAILDRNSQVQELIETNNAAAGNRIGVGNKPDIVVTQVSTAVSAPVGGQVQVTVTSCNQGTQSGSAPLDLFFSSDATITAADFWVGSLPPGPSLSPGMCTTQIATAWAPGPEGVYFVGAIADRNNGLMELIEDNNAAAGNKVGVGSKPDLTVTQASTSATSAQSGNQVPVTVTYCNQGTQPGSAPVDIFFTNDPSSQGYYSTSVPPGPSLSPGACNTQTVQAPVVVPNGPAWVVAVIDSYNSVPELMEDNNTLVGSRIGVGYGPDFAVTQASTAPSAQSGGQVNVTVTYCNLGTQSGSAPVDLYFSTDSTITSTDFFAGSLPPGPMLSPGGCYTQTVSAWAPPDGVYWVGAIADRYNSIIELIEDNNAFAGTKIGVGYGPDLIVTQVSAPPSITPGSALNVTTTVCNQGTSSGSAPVDVMISNDASIGLEDTFAGTLPPTPNLAPNACITLSGTVWPPVPSGAYYVGAIADRLNGLHELQEDNNARAGGRLAIGYGPDLVVTLVSGPASAPAYSPILVTATVCNQGTSASDAGRLDVYLSSDATITTTDPWAGSLPNPGYLVPGACVTVSGTVPAVSPQGTYRLGAIADSQGWVTELLEDDNAGVAAGTLTLY